MLKDAILLKLLCYLRCYVRVSVSDIKESKFEEATLLWHYTVKGTIMLVTAPYH